ncbi:MAG: hypothetical protein RIE56_13805 [Amphiplicatus sp.]
MRKLLATAVAGFIGCAIAAPAANAGLINEAALAACVGQAVCNVGGTTITPSGGGNLDSKTVDGQFGLGIAGQTGGEIDINESMHIAFNADVILNAIKIVFIYNGPEYGDPDEQGEIGIEYADGSFGSALLSVTGENTATLNGFAGVSCGATDGTGSGCFLFSGDPLGALAVKAISITALPGIFSGGETNNSDFSLASYEFSEVPIPGAALLLLSGLGGLGFASRRRKA